MAAASALKALQSRSLAIAAGAFLVATGAAATIAAFRFPLGYAARVVGPDVAVSFRVQAGLVAARALSMPAVLLLGDSRIAALAPTHPPAPPMQVNVGIPGSTARQWRTVLDGLAAPPSTETAAQSDAKRYDAAVIWLGVNDFILRDAPAEGVAEDLLHVVEVLRVRAPARRVVVLEQIPLRLGDEARSRDLSVRAAELNRQLARALVEQPQARLLPLFDSLRSADGLLARWCSEDGVHLNPAGNRWLWDRLDEALR